MKQALVDIEDSRFYEHHGLDVEGTLRALLRNLRAGTVLEGGSTITQQLVKQTLLQTAVTPEERAAATEDSVGRKLREARLALALEEKYSKDEILTRYLNLVYFGAGRLRRPGRRPGVLQRRRGRPDARPGRRPRRTGPDADGRQPDQRPGAGPGAAQPGAGPDAHPRPHHRGAVRRDRAAAGRRRARSPGRRTAASTPLIGGFFCDYLQRYLTRTLGISQQTLEDGGLVIRTTLRTDLQRSGDQAVLNYLALGDPLAGMFTAVEPGTGHVLAMSVNRRFGYDVNDPAQESVNLNLVASQGAGSTYKVFVAASALEQGVPPWNRITTSDPYTSRVYKNGFDPYTVQNAGRYPPTLTMVQALVRVVQHLLRRARGPARQRRGPGAHGPADGAVLPRPGRRPGGRGEPRLVHPRRRGDQPARPGQRLLDAGRQRHAVRPDAGHRDPRLGGSR